MEDKRGGRPGGPARRKLWRMERENEEDVMEDGDNNKNDDKKKAQGVHNDDN